MQLEKSSRGASGNLSAAAMNKRISIKKQQQAFFRNGLTARTRRTE